MKKMPRMVEAMTPFPYTVGLIESLQTAHAIMAAKKVRHLPVLDEGRLVGLLSDRDIRTVLSVATSDEERSALRVGDACALEIYSVDHEDRLDQVVERMAADHLGSAVVTKNGKVVGIFTTIDACRELGNLLKHHYTDA